MAYQNIDGAGDSDSIGKAMALSLPVMTGLSFLDVGCNEGFFCGFALANGANRVVGVDVHEGFIVDAKLRFPGVEFVLSSWDDYLRQSVETFDIILLASSLHYAEDQEKMILALCSKLQPKGLLVVEAGFVHEDGPDNFVPVDRWDGPKLYPRLSYMTRFLEEHGYSVVRVNPSVTQAGDSMPRSVIHVRKRYIPLLLNFEAPDKGKTELGRIFSKHLVGWVSLDQMICDYTKTLSDPLLSMFPENIPVLLNYLTDSTLFNPIIEAVCALDRSRLNYVEGYLTAELVQRMLAALEARDIPYFLVSAGINKFASKVMDSRMPVMTERGVIFMQNKDPVGSIDVISLIRSGGKFGAMLSGWMTPAIAKQVSIIENKFALIIQDIGKVGRIVKFFDRIDLAGIGRGFEAFFELTEDQYKTISAYGSVISQPSIKCGLINANQGVEELMVTPNLLRNIALKTDPL